MTYSTLYLLSPEILLVLVGVLTYLVGRTPGRLAAAGLVAAAVILPLSASAGSYGPVVCDGLSLFVRGLALATGMLLLLTCSGPRAEGDRPEYVGSLLLAVAGVMLAASANELVLVFLGLELVSIPTYILLYLARRDAASHEATAKYFFLSILASALLLYGFSFLYGLAGSMELPVIAQRLGMLPADGTAKLARLALVFVFAGLGFKLTAAPFHFYAPDVYQGTSNANAALLSVLPKAAGLAVLVRIVAMSMPGVGPYDWRLVAAVSVLSMTLGNILALWQDNLRRLMAYSSIAQSGYLLVGLAAGLAGHAPPGWNGTGTAIFYLVVYVPATVGTFAALVYLGREQRQIDSVDQLAGVGKTHPWAAAAVAVCMFSLAGIPPLAGFWGKLTVFGAALAVPGQTAGPSPQPWLVGLAIVGVLNSVVAAAYYLRVVAVMYFRAPLATPKAEGGVGPWAATLLCVAAVLAIGLYSSPLLRAALDAATR
jgi:NADH-quinone oxidoreductase subunit N